MKSACMEFEAGDVLYGRLRPYLNKVCRPTFTGLASAEFITFRDFDRVDPAFLKYALNHPDFVAFANQVKEGDRPRVKWSQIRSFPLGIPPIDEQQRIVGTIDEQFSRLDAGVESLRRANRNLARLRASVLKAAVEGRLVAQDPTEGQGHELVVSILEDRRQRWRESQPSKSYKEPQEPSQPSHDAPETWGIATLESLTDPKRVICYGILKPKTDGELTVPYVEVRDIRDGRIDVAGLNRTTQELHSQFPRSHLKAGDVLIAVRGSYDRSAVVPPDLTDANISRDVARLAPLEGLVSEFLALYLHSPPVLAHFRRIARGVAVKGINISSIRELSIRVPTVPEQHRIVAEVDRRLSVVDAMSAMLKASHERSYGLRQSILQEAFAGRLREGAGVGAYR